MTHLLIDADPLVYSAGLTAQYPEPFAEDPGILHDCVDLREAERLFDEKIAEYMRHFNAATYTLCLSDSVDNWRHDVMPSYKGGRLPDRRPLAYDHLRARAIEYLAAQMETRLEGDDLLGIMATSPSREGHTVLCSIDKDMATIPGWFCRIPMSGPLPVAKLITPEAAHRFHMLQTLMGDRTDGYFGCPGLGEKRATALLETEGDSWDVIVKAYVDRGSDEAEALRNAQVSRIMHYGDYDFESQEVKLWQPA